MSRGRRQYKPDDNEAAIRDACRQCGASVQSLAVVGFGCPDLVVGYRGANYLIEVKDGTKPPSKRQLTADESDWHVAWRGQVVVISSAEDAVRFLAVADRAGAAVG